MKTKKVSKLQCRQSLSGGAHRCLGFFCVNRSPGPEICLFALLFCVVWAVV